MKNKIVFKSQKDCVTILLLSNEPMNVRRMKAYETNQ